MAYYISIESNNEDKCQNIRMFDLFSLYSEINTVGSFLS